MGKHRSLPPAARLSIVAVLLLLNACASPRDSFYTLSPASSQPVSAQKNAPIGAQADARHSVAVGPVRVPEIVNRPQFVVRRGPNQVELAEQRRGARARRAGGAGARAAGRGRRRPRTRGV